MKKENIIFSIFVLLVLLPLFGSNASTQFSEKENFPLAYPSFHDTIPIPNLIENYKPEMVLSYDTAREILYTQIYNVKDTVSCVYSGYKLPLLHTEENPIMKLMKLNVFNSIITEHSYPKCKGALEGNANSDMHLLFPVRLGVNVSRYNHPFGDVNEEECDVWYFEREKYNSKPVGFDSLCAKEGSGKFEPRDSFKGNVARAVFYFYTMYKTEADSADETFFEKQRETLLAWHKQDPVDEQELNRTRLIAKYQSGKPNPFVIDESLASRLYSSENALTE